MGNTYEITEDGEAIDRFEVRDLRVKTRFSIDNALFDEFAEVLGPATTVIYMALVRHSNKEQKTWPSQKRIADKVKLSEKWVRTQLYVLECFNMIRKVRVGKMCTNRYYLLDEKHWRRDFEAFEEELSDAIELIKKLEQKLGRKVKGTEFRSLLKGTESPSVMGTGVPLVGYSSSYRAVSRFRSNRKDKQSKDKGGRKVKLVKKEKSAKPSVRPQSSYRYDPERNVMVEEPGNRLT